MRALSPTEVHAKSVELLGLDPTSTDLQSVEAIACALRRQAGFLCPCSGRTLVRAVLGPLQGLTESTEGLRELIENTLEALVVHGDLLELREADREMSGGGVLLYAAPPSFIQRHSGAIMILGITSDCVSPFPKEIESYIRYINHVRILDQDAGPDLGDQLAELGLIKQPIDVWLKAPKKEKPSHHLDKINRIMSGSQPVGEVPGLMLLDPDQPVRYYPGRWIETSNQTGRFVSRRPQAYGADLWCYVEVNNGQPVRLIDFPLPNSVGRGCDDAWRLQAAIDCERGRPQLFRVRPGASGSRLMDFYSPVPMWCRRRWDAIGELTPGQGSLFSYEFSEMEFDEEFSFAKEHLWLKEIN